MEANDLCQRLSWDSDFFGLNIARLNPNHLTPEIAKEAVAWSESNNVDCLYFLAEADDPATVRLAEDNAFRFMDIRVTLDRHLHRDASIDVEKAGPGTVRPHEPADVPALKAIARASHHDSRFYYDPNFPEDRCDDLYETWIEKSCNGYADMVLVADIGGEAEGYISCHLPAQGEGQIGLVGIAARSQGKGLGQRLVNEALRWFAEKGVSHVTVVTQGRNANAQRLYQRCGFVTRDVQLWYHRWFPKAMV